MGGKNDRSRENQTQVQNPQDKLGFSPRKRDQQKLTDSDKKTQH